MGRKVHHTILDKGAPTLVLSMSCWRAIGSLEVNQSPTTFKAFDERGLYPYGLLPTLYIEIRGKTISIQVEVVESSLDYNLLLGRNWFYTMTVFASSIFYVL